ncbi:hypothetical protein Pint_09582 [Pistacia integerrima]|uniref:Uncharacterized protein n=1 Tax=Pistacia integerrima TaxID=434235 RepID=A0ACC0XEX0_9ROSI|nr:hypothetical protein Pint_09582 [Pistacia integerrima]
MGDSTTGEEADDVALSVVLEKLNFNFNSSTAKMQVLFSLVHLLCNTNTSIHMLGIVYRKSRTLS